MIDLDKLAIDFTDEELDDCEIIDAGDWLDDGKYSFLSTIIKYKDKFYQINQNRTGSYWTDYNYGDPEAYEVEPYEVTVTQYRVVK